MNLGEHMKFDMENVFVTSDHHFGSWKLAPNLLRSPDIERNRVFRQIYGHEHVEGGQLHPMDPARSFCSCVMRNGGFPVALEAALAKMDADAMVCRTSGIQK